MTETILHSHSELGPSAAERWLACPGSVLAIRGVNKLPTEYSAEGVFAHTVSEWAREQNVPVIAFKGREVEVDGFKFKVTKAVAEHIQVFVDSVTKLPGVPFIEGRVYFEQLVPGGFGTLDDARMEDGLCVITDLKFGKGVKVTARENPQLRLYAAGLFFSLGWAIEFNKFILRISQPRLLHFEEEELSLGQLLQWAYDVVRPVAKIALTPGSALKAGPHCKFCPIKDTCSVRASYKANYERSPDSPEEAFVDLENV